MSVLLQEIILYEKVNWAEGAKFRSEVVTHVKPFIPTCFVFLPHVTAILRCIHRGAANKFACSIGAHLFCPDVFRGFASCCILFRAYLLGGQLEILPLGGGVELQPLLSQIHITRKGV